jgi:hypothetical protein
LGADSGALSGPRPGQIPASHEDRPEFAIAIEFVTARVLGPETELVEFPAEHPTALVALAAKAIAGPDRTQVPGCRRADAGVEDVEMGIRAVASATVIVTA